MVKVQSDKSSLEKDMHRYQTLRSVYTKETGKLLKLLSTERLARLIAITRHNMSRCVSSITLQKTITHFFEQLNRYIDQASAHANDIAILSENINRDFEKEHGIEYAKVRRLRLEEFKDEIIRLEQKHANLKTTKTLFFKEQMTITNRFYDSACVAASKIFSNALKSANNWNSNLMVPMETHVREHHTQLRRRLESVKRIHKTSDTVETRLQELSQMQRKLLEQHKQFEEFQQSLSSQIKLANQTEESSVNTDLTSSKILYLDKKLNIN
jgi:DNA repair ATPase RecN